jgi:hypothetical protein
MACWNVCPAGCEDFGAVSRMGGDDLDGWLVASWLYLRTLRNVETPPCAECELDSAKPKTAAVEGCADIRCLPHDGLSDTANNCKASSGKDGFSFRSAARRRAGKTSSRKDCRPVEFAGPGSSLNRSAWVQPSCTSKSRLGFSTSWSSLVMTPDSDFGEPERPSSDGLHFVFGGGYREFARDQTRKEEVSLSYEVAILLM